MSYTPVSSPKKRGRKPRDWSQPRPCSYCKRILSKEAFSSENMRYCRPCHRLYQMPPRGWEGKLSREEAAHLSTEPVPIELRHRAAFAVTRYALEDFDQTATPVPDLHKLPFFVELAKEVAATSCCCCGGSWLLVLNPDGRAFCALCSYGVVRCGVCSYHAPRSAEPFYPALTCNPVPPTPPELLEAHRAYREALRATPSSDPMPLGGQED